MIIILLTTGVILFSLFKLDGSERVLGLLLSMTVFVWGMMLSGKAYNDNSLSKTFTLEETSQIVGSTDDNKADVQMICEDGTQYYYVITVDQNGNHKYEKLKVKETELKLVPITSQTPYLEKGTQKVDNLIFYSIPIPPQKHNIIYFTEDMKITTCNNCKDDSNKNNILPVPMPVPIL